MAKESKSENLISTKSFLEAAESGDLKIVKEFLENKGDIEVKNDNGKTALHLAVWYGHLEVARLLLDRGIKVNNRDKINDSTALHLAIGSMYLHEKGNNIEFIKLLLDNKADIDLSDTDGNTSLHLAVRNRSTEIVKFLLQRLVKIDLQNQRGHTALHLAVDVGLVEIVELLLERMAQTDIDFFGEPTVLDFANRKKNESEKKPTGLSVDYQEKLQEIVKLLEHDKSNRVELIQKLQAALPPITIGDKEITIINDYGQITKEAMVHNTEIVNRFFGSSSGYLPSKLMPVDLEEIIEDYAEIKTINNIVIGIVRSEKSKSNETEGSNSNQPLDIEEYGERLKQFENETEQKSKDDARSDKERANQAKTILQQTTKNTKVSPSANPEPTESERVENKRSKDGGEKGV